MIPTLRISLPTAERKRLGAFYTPENLSRILTDWAIRTPSDLILEPSFGGCGFLVAARRRLESLGAEKPKNQIYGCDIDDGAFEFLAEALGLPVDSERFIHKDFLSTRALVEWPKLFDATIGNPPYIPYQSIAEDKRKNLIDNAESLGVTLGGKSSLWAHFLFHAVSFVAPNGRMAWVLPGSFLQADYAINIRKYLARSFSDVICILMHQRFFKAEGTEEETVVLLAKGRGEYESESSIVFVDALDVSQLELVVEKWDAGKPIGQPLIGRPSFLSVGEKLSELYKQVLSEASCCVLGDLLKINIGLVTGANKFFVLDSSAMSEAGLTACDVLPILGKFKFAKGLNFTGSDFADIVDEGGRAYLVNSKTPPIKRSGLYRYLQTFGEENRNKVSTFKKRELWHAPDDGRIPDAFFPVMNHHGPRLVLNELRINCTNTIHRAFFKEVMTPVQKKLVSISMLTSFSQISAEFVGRRYGSGVLKHEPRESEKIALLLPDLISPDVVHKCHAEIDYLLRAGLHNEASVKADELIFGCIPEGMHKANIFALALCKVRELRKTNRHRSGV